MLKFTDLLSPKLTSLRVTKYQFFAFSGSCTNKLVLVVMWCNTKMPVCLHRLYIMPNRWERNTNALHVGTENKLQ